MVLRHDEGARTVLSFEFIVVMPHHLPSDLTIDSRATKLRVCRGPGLQSTGWAGVENVNGQRGTTQVTRDGLGLVVLCRN